MTFPAPGGLSLAGTLHVAPDPAAPLLVFVHRFRGDRAEWAEVARRMAAATPRYHVLTFDLRGHGDSKVLGGKRVVDWGSMKPAEIPAMVEDIHAAITYARARVDGRAERVVLVGSSLGAALVARAASEEARVVAVGLVSPGAAISGYDVYHPFAEVRMLPSFLAGSRDDNVSVEPLDALGRMGKEMATVRGYDGGGHGAFGLISAGTALVDDLSAWLEKQFGAEPLPRAIQSRGNAAGGKKE
ncbi:MAG: alpha/beta fold hydrolase [Deltaproteobacteria bacterium]|nr:alpha/beta fold hydrolase [Deltaproteobacteria bacterium]